MITTIKHKWSGNFLRCILFILFIFSFTPSQTHAGTQLWQLRTQAGYVDASPGIGDLDRDGVNDLVLGTTVGQVMAVNSGGYIMWTFDTNAHISNPSTVADLDGDQKLEVLVLTNTGKVVCLDGKSGALNWNFNLPAKVNWGTTSLASGHLLNDNKLEIIAADSKGHLVCLDFSGKQLWSKKINEEFNTCPAIADLNSDGKNEILAGSTTSPLICFSAKGKELWRVKEKSAGSSPLVYDLDNNNEPEIILGCGDNLTVFDNKGKVIWQYNMKSSIHDAISIGDLDFNGTKEIVAVDLGGNVVCLDEKGKLRWTANVVKKVRRSPTIADIDNDSKLDILIAGYNSNLYVLTNEGDLKEEIQLLGKCNASPTIVDFNYDGRLAVICPNMGDVSAFSWMTSKPGVKPVIQFSEYRGNSVRSGTSKGAAEIQTAHIASIDFGQLYITRNEFCVKVKNPKKKKLALELKVTQNNTTPLFQSVTFQDTTFVFRLPYYLTAQSAVDIQFSATLKRKSTTISVLEKSFYIIPYAKDMADFRSTLAAIQALLPQLPESGYAANQLQLLKSRFSPLEERMQIAGTLSALQRTELREQVASLRKEANVLLKMAEAAADAGSPLAVYAANPWAPFGNVDEILEGRTNAADVSVFAFSGETESAAFNIANFSDKPVFVRIEPGALISQKDSSSVLAQKVLKLHEVIDVPSETADKSSDALPLLGQGQTMMIPQWSLRQLWINVNTADLGPGVWKNSVRIRSLEVEPHEAVANLTVHVSEIALPEEQALKLCHWGYVHRSILKNMPQAALDDQIVHGTNVFVATNTFAPSAKFDKTGNIIGEIDFSKHDDYVRQHSPHGIILFFSYQGALKGPAKHHTPVWEKAQAVWLKTWFDHLNTLGIDYKDFALYPVDEPGLREGLVDLNISYAKVIRKVNKNVQIYTDPVAGASLDDLKKLAPYVDIWCPNRNGFLLDVGAEKLAFIKSTGKKVWTYECEDNAKHQSPIGYYRAQSWLALHHGLTGIGFWSYCTSSFDPWYTPVGSHDYLLIYQGEGVVTSKRWEAIRDGIEDYNMMFMLKQAIENATQNVDVKTMQAAKKLLKKDTFEIAATCGMASHGAKPKSGDMSMERNKEDRNWEKIQSTRKKLARLLESIKK